jgi:Predicted Zn-dependent protease (DUF2268)
MCNISNRLLWRNRTLRIGDGQEAPDAARSGYTPSTHARRHPPSGGLEIHVIEIPTQLRLWTWVIAAAACMCSPNAARAAAAGSGPQILTRDVDLFYRVYDAANGRPSVSQLQHDYIDAGSEGLHQFTKVRDLSGETLAQALAKHPEVYSGAKRCAPALGDVRRRLTVALRKLGELYPEAKYPPVTILIGRNNTGGATSQAGVLIGLEVLCRANWLEPNVEDRFVHLIAHEYIHVQQPIAEMEDPNTTVLLSSETEGGAEFIAEMICGSVSNTHLSIWTKGREREIENAFVADEDKTDKSDWLYNGPGTPQKPGDLGYWVGYRIVKSYYQHAPNKLGAVSDIIQVRDAKAFLARSGWVSGDRAAVAAGGRRAFRALHRHLRRQQPIVFPFHDRVALAGALLQSRTIQHRDVPARVSNEPRLLQLERPFGHPFAAYSQHVGNEFLRHHQLIAPQPIQAQQQPTAELLIQRMMPITRGRLRHLRNQGLRVAQHQVQHRSAARELGLHDFGIETATGSGTLHHGTAGGGFPAHEQ